MRESVKVSRGFTVVEIVIVILIIGILAAVALPKFEVSQTVASIAEARQGLQSVVTGVFAYRDATSSGESFPPGGGVQQSGWIAWTDEASGMSPNTPENNFHACSVIWMSGSFYDSRGDSGPQFAAAVPSTATHYDLRVLTSPVETMSFIPRDPFKENGARERSQYDYFGINLMEEFVLRSLGPDGIADIGCDSGGFNCGCIESECLQLGTTVVGRRPFDPSLDSHFDCPECTTLEEAITFGRIVYSPTNGIDTRGDLFYSSANGIPMVSRVTNWRIH